MCMYNNRLCVQQFRDGVMLRMSCGLTLATLFVRFFDMYYVATIPKSRFEFLDSFLIFLTLYQPMTHRCVMTFVNSS